jgi:hypothetical protein
MKCAIGSLCAVAVHPGTSRSATELMPRSDSVSDNRVPQGRQTYACGRPAHSDESRHVCGALASVGRTIPTFRNIGVDTAVASIFADTIKSVDAAIKAADSAQFSTAYGEMTAACNTCHVGMERPFVVTKVPDAPKLPASGVLALSRWSTTLTGRLGQLLADQSPAQERCRSELVTHGGPVYSTFHVGRLLFGRIL